MHRNDRISADQRPMTIDEFDRFPSAQKINQVFLAQATDQREVMAQDSARHRIPARIDDKDAEARISRRLVFLRSSTLPNAGGQLDDHCCRRTLPRGRYW